MTRTRRTILSLVLLSLALVACGKNTPTPLPGEPVRDPVELRSAEILLLESFPVQVMLKVKVEMPTVCHELKWDVAKPDDQNRIIVDLYALGDPAALCVQMIGESEASIPLGSYASGEFTVWVNGEKVGEFEV